MRFYVTPQYFTMRRLHGFAITACSAICLLWAGTLYGQTTVNWADGSQSGAFLTDEHWVGDEVPGSGQFFLVNASEEITVTLGSNYSVGGFRGGASNGVWTMDMGGNTLSLLSVGTGATERSFSMPNASNLRQLTIANGTFAAKDVDFRGVQTTVEVAVGGVFTTEGINITNAGTLLVKGTVSATSRIATSTGSSVTVDGGSLTVTGDPVYAGVSGLVDESVVHFKNGATVNSTLLIAGRNTLSSGLGSANPGGKGLFLIEGAGTTAVTQRLFLSGGSRSTGSTSDNNPSEEGIGTLHIFDGAVVNTDYLQAYERSTIFIDNASLTVGNALMGSIVGGKIHEGATLRFGLHSPLQPLAMSVDIFDITNADLEIVLGSGFSADISDEFILISYATSLAGTFKGYGEGSVITVDGYSFELSYGTGGEDSWVSLTVIPEPGVAAALFGLVVLAFSRLRRVR